MNEMLDLEPGNVSDTDYTETDSEWYEEDSSMEAFSRVFIINNKIDMTPARKLTKMISKSRANEVHYASAVGRALYGISKGNDDGFEIWRSWLGASTDANNEIFEDLDEIWDSFNTRRLSEKTLAHYAKTDSPRRYARWHRERVMMALDACLKDMNHKTVIDLVYAWCWDKHVCSSTRSKEWYSFCNHRLVKNHDGKYLREDISSVAKMVEHYRTVLSRQAEKSYDEEVKKMKERMIVKCNTLRAKLQDLTYGNKIVNGSAFKFHVDNFNSKLDSDGDVMGILNGVVEVCADGKAIVRPGKFEDFITKHSMVPWNKRVASSKSMRDLDKWLRDCFYTDEMIQYFLNICASMLKGGNQDKIIPFFTGKVDNSKSQIKKLIECTFGTYCVNFPPEVFAPTKGGNGPSPQIAQGKGARVAFTQEFGKKNVFATTLLKMFSGDDSFYARKNYDDGGSLESSFLLIMICNSLPKMELDEAMKRRVKTVLFDSLWVEDPDTYDGPVPKHRVHKIDPNFKKKISRMAPAFLYKIVKQYEIYSRTGINEPEKVTRASEAYWNKNNPYCMFAKERLEQAVDENGEIDFEAVISEDDLMDEFRLWLSSYDPRWKGPCKSDFVSSMVHVLGEPEDGYFKGYVFA